MTKNNKKTHEEDTDYTDEQGGGGETKTPLTKEEFFEVLDKVVKADPKKRQSPDEGKSKT